jgi:hypothetical protein
LKLQRKEGFVLAELDGLQAPSLPPPAIVGEEAVVATRTARLPRAPTPGVLPPLVVLVLGLLGFVLFVDRREPLRDEELVIPAKPVLVHRWSGLRCRMAKERERGARDERHAREHASRIAKALERRAAPDDAPCAHEGDVEDQGLAFVVGVGLLRAVRSSRATRPEREEDARPEHERDAHAALLVRPLGEAFRDRAIERRGGARRGLQRRRDLTRHRGGHAATVDLDEHEIVHAEAPRRLEVPHGEQVGSPKRADLEGEGGTLNLVCRQR